MTAGAFFVCDLKTVFQKKIPEISAVGDQMILCAASDINVGEVRFAGQFFGHGFSISGLYCNLTGNGAHAGLFDTLTSAHISDLLILDSYFAAPGENGIAGAIAANAGAATITNCYNEATVTARHYAGGIAGTAGKANFDHCGNAGKVTASELLSCTGGILGSTHGVYGESSTTAVNYCYNTGKVTNTHRGEVSAYYTGALVGNPQFAAVFGSYYDPANCSEPTGAQYDATTFDPYENCSVSRVESRPASDFSAGTVCEQLDFHASKWSCTNDAHEKRCRVCDEVTIEKMHHTIGTDCTVGGDCTDCGYTVSPGTHKFSDGVCIVCAAVCRHTGGTPTCTAQAVCDNCGASYGEMSAHTINATTGKCETCGLVMAAATTTVDGTTTSYQTIQEALDAAAQAESAIVTLLRSDENVTGLILASGNVQLDMKGLTLKGSVSQNGILQLSVPKAEQKRLPKTTTIAIE